MSVKFLSLVVGLLHGLRTPELNLRKGNQHNDGNTQGESYTTQKINKDTRWS